MSHPRTVIEPADGLTVLTGENNTGKSAVISALQILCRNISGDYMVRHGQRECRITVETEEGHVLEWKRKNGVVSYTVNGREVHRLRGSVPGDLHDLLRMPLVETEGDPFDVHFGEQKKPIFLLDESPARRATFFASSSDAIKLIEMQNRHRIQVRDARNEEGRLMAEAGRLEQRLGALAPLDAAEERVAQAEAEHAALLQGVQAVSVLRSHAALMEKVRVLAEKHAAVAAAARTLLPPPEMAETEPMQRAIRQMSHLAVLLAAASETVKAAAGLEPPPPVADTRHLSDLVLRMRHLAHAGAEAGQRGRVLEACPEPPEMLDIAAVGRHIEAMEKAWKTMERCAGELDRAEKGLFDAGRDLRRAVERYNICPTCGQPMDAERILHQAHASGYRA